jgi:hypothetical protein
MGVSCLKKQKEIKKMAEKSARLAWLCAEICRTHQG